MGDYTGMSGHYDLIMQSGYYDYDAIVDTLAGFDHAGSVLELGSGTGLILERLATRRPALELTGIDLTQAMLDIAAKRLAPFPQVGVHRQDVAALSLPGSYDLAFSYGGVWYFSTDSTDSADSGASTGCSSMVSHIRDPGENRRGLERLAEHLPSGGTLLLGIQGPHSDYTRPVTASLEYIQRITPIAGGFRKDYALWDGATRVMEQTIDYRVYPFEEAIALLAECGFDHLGRAAGNGPAGFEEFRRR